MAVLSNPLRYAFDEAARRPPSSPAATPDRPPVAEDEEPGLEGTGYYSPMRSTFANGMHAVDRRDRPGDGRDPILRYCVVHDCGTLINPMIVEGQIHGGVAQGVGGALYERMEYDEHGQLLNASFMDFLMPYATEVPDDRDRPPGDAVAAEPAGHQGRGRGGGDPRHGGVRRRHRGRRGLPRSTRCRSRPRELFELRRARQGTAEAAHQTDDRGGPHEGQRIRRPARRRQQVWDALNDPAVLVGTIPGCEPLAALGDGPLP